MALHKVLAKRYNMRGGDPEGIPGWNRLSAKRERKTPTRKALGGAFRGNSRKDAPPNVETLDASPANGIPFTTMKRDRHAFVPLFKAQLLVRMPKTRYTLCPAREHRRTHWALAHFALDPRSADRGTGLLRAADRSGPGSHRDAKQHPGVSTLQRGRQ